MKTIASLIREHLEENGDQYNLENSLSIAVLALDLQAILTMERK